MSGSPLQVLVQEAPQRQLAGDRVDVREPRQVAHERGDRGAAPAPGRQQRAHRVGPADLHGDLARQLEHVVVEQEEARQAEPLDHAQLLLQARPRPLRRHRGPVRGWRRLGHSAPPAAPRTAPPDDARRPRPRPPDSGSRGPCSDRTSVARPAPASRGPRRDGRRSGWPSPGACSSRGCGCRGATARRRRAWRGGGAPRTHPAARPWQRACACTSPVATHLTPSRRACAASARLRARSWRAYGRCSSTYRPSGPNASSSRLAACSSCTPPPIADRSAQPVRQTRPSAWSITACKSTHGSARSRPDDALAGVPVGERDDPAEVAPAALVAHEQRHVTRPRPSRPPPPTRSTRRRRRGGRARRPRRSRRRGSPSPRGRPRSGRAPSSRRRSCGRSARAPHGPARPRAAPARVAARRRPGTSTPSGSAAQRTAAFLSGSSEMVVKRSRPSQEPWMNQRPERRSWKTTTLRPRSPTSSQ